MYIYTIDLIEEHDKKKNKNNLNKIIIRHNYSVLGVYCIYVCMYHM